ncbi:hypothetical protein [Lentibacillus sp. Marseille-P4043]|uniref:hypothetical protein n=1 Tax=Lentibacillus sp. Marseille-P4043 TaxID=2040293 RepID=UPI0018F8A93E|nr:hypothetical protein [Lentibacillus sp. Marseille-P4043]
MNVWIFFVIPLGGLLLIGIIADLIAKLRGKKINLERDKNTSESGNVYSEGLKQNDNPF